MKGKQMRTDLLSLGVERTPNTDTGERAIEDYFSGLLGDKVMFCEYPTERAFLNTLAVAVSRDDIAVLSVDSDLFDAFKNFVGAAFKLDMRPNRNVFRAIKKSYPSMPDDTVNSHSKIPSGATPLITADGLYSGFVIKARSQNVFVLPLDQTRTAIMLSGPVADYIKQFVHIQPDVPAAVPVIPEAAAAPATIPAPVPVVSDAASAADIAQPVPVDAVPEVPEKVFPKAESFFGKGRKKEKKKDEEPAPQEILPYNDALASKTAEMLSAEGVTVALANTKTVDFLGLVSKKVPLVGDLFLLSDYYIEKDQMPAREYAVKLAKGARETVGSELGAAITKVYSVTHEDGRPLEMYIYVCIANDENANAVKLFADEEMTPPDLIYAAVDQLFKMLYHYMGGDDENQPQKPVDTSKPEDEGPVIFDNEKIHKMNVITASLFGASAACAAIVSLICTDFYHLL